jgi:hypothetical protein
MRIPFVGPVQCDHQIGHEGLHGYTSAAGATVSFGTTSNGRSTFRLVYAESGNA